MLNEGVVGHVIGLALVFMKQRMKQGGNSQHKLVHFLLRRKLGRDQLKGKYCRQTEPEDLQHRNHLVPVN